MLLWIGKENKERFLLWLHSNISFWKNSEMNYGMSYYRRYKSVLSTVSTEFLHSIPASEETMLVYALFVDEMANYILKEG
jgi:hypothetical protein